MERDANNIEFPPSIQSAIRMTAGQLIGNYGFTVAEREDLQQDILADCLLRLRKFDPTRSSCLTFLRRIVRHRVATLVDAQCAARRDFRRCGHSLDGPAGPITGESVPLAETLSADDYRARSGLNSLSSRERLELRLDVDSAIALLPADLAVVAALLKSVSVVEAAERLVLSRATVYRRINDIRRIFKSAGLDLYLSRSGTASVRHHRRSLTSGLPEQVPG
jgi:RNA polymerase sigma-70 factor (ECF subfamily)